jgi:CHAD domain-containing protein
VKARKVKGLDPHAPLRENASRIAQVRLDELYSFAPAALDPGEVKALHDMRIAAKRLRYVFEVTEGALGKLAKDGAKEARRLQDILGEIHDCDEMVPRALAHMDRLRAEDVEATLSMDGAEAEDLAPAAVREAPNRRRYRGLEALVTYLRARRQFLHHRFLGEWQRLEDEGFRDRIEGGLAAARRDGSNVKV